MYSEFYKTAIGVCESDDVVNRYKESRNPAIINSKVNAINNVLKSLGAKTADKPTVQFQTQAPALDRMFPVKSSFDKTQDPRDSLAKQLEELRIAQANAIKEVKTEFSQELQSFFGQGQGL